MFLLVQAHRNRGGGGGAGGGVGECGGAGVGGGRGCGGGGCGGGLEFCSPHIFLLTSIFNKLKKIVLKQKTVQSYKTG